MVYACYVSSHLDVTSSTRCRKRCCLVDENCGARTVIDVCRETHPLPNIAHPMVHQATLAFVSYHTRKPCTFPTCMDQCKHAETRLGGPLTLKPASQVSNCKPCCDPPDWINHPQLRYVKECDIRNYRQCRLQRWLEHLVNRLPCEPFGAFIGRCFETAEHELNYNNQSKQCNGDEFPHALDRYVCRLCLGAKLNLAKHGVNVSADEELLLLQLLREECNELYWTREIIPYPNLSPKSEWNHPDE